MFADEYDSGTCSALYSWRGVKPRLKGAYYPPASMALASELICRQHPVFQVFAETLRIMTTSTWDSKHKTELVNLAKHPASWRALQGCSPLHTFKPYKAQKDKK